MTVNFNAALTKLLSSMYQRETFLYSISMADASLQEIDSLHQIELPFPADVKWKDNFESLARSVAKKTGSVCHAKKYFLTRV